MNLLYWLQPWEPSPTVVVAVLATALLYARGCTRIHVSFARQLSFYTGLAGIYVVLHTRLDYYFEHEFFMHRLQHLVLHHLGPFLIALSYPGNVLRAALPVRFRRACLIPTLRQPAVKLLLDIVLNPLVAVLLFVGLIYFWLWSPLHFKAMLDWRLYRLMNWSVAIDGLMFWCLVLDPRSSPPARLSPGWRILIAIAAMPPQILLGAFIFFQAHDIYPIYAICGRAWAGMSALRDQQLGGLLLWIPGSMMSVVGALIALRNWLRLSARGRQPIRRR